MRRSIIIIASRPPTKSIICNNISSIKAIWQNITARQHWTVMEQTQICRIRLKKVHFSISTSALRSYTSCQPHRGEATPRLKVFITHTRLKIEVSSKEVGVVIAQSNSTRTRARASLTTSNIPPCSISKDRIKLWWQPLQRLLNRSSPLAC